MDALRSALQPLTHNLPGPVVDTGRSILGDACYKNLIVDIDPFKAPECVKLAVSKGLSYGIIGAAGIVKIPQIVKLLRSQSAEGVSFLSYALESSAYLISLAYNIRHGFPFSTYGETALILAQNLVIATLVLNLSSQGKSAPVYLSAFACAGALLFRADLVDEQMLNWLQGAAGVLGIASKLPQILTIWQQGGTGQLSAFAVMNYLLGSLSRIYTTLQEVDDKLILYGFVAGFILNLILALQVVYYWNAPASKVTAAKKPKPITAEKVNTGESTSYAKMAAKSPSTRRRG